MRSLRALGRSLTGAAHQVLLGDSRPAADSGYGGANWVPVLVT